MPSLSSAATCKTSLVNLARGDDHIAQESFRHLPEQLLRRFLVPAGQQAVFVDQARHGVARDGGGVDYHGHPHGDHLYPQRFLRQAQTVVSHAAARLDARIGDLHGGADALALKGGQRVDGDDSRGTHMAHQPAAQFRRLDARQSQHAGRDGAHPPQPAAQPPWPWPAAGGASPACAPPRGCPARRRSRCGCQGPPPAPRPRGAAGF